MRPHQPYEGRLIQVVGEAVEDFVELPTEMEGAIPVLMKMLPTY